ncbi:MAG: putative DNA-binding ribbon-helix-helix protein [Paracoccaceae bacterium]|jgi:predicted DNA-binding ribbon-helix-helix protein
MTAEPPTEPPVDLRPPAKRSLTIQGHRTSVSLEPAFWDGFRALADRRGMAINALAARIDAGRPPDVGLATAIRLAVLADLTARLSLQG